MADPATPPRPGAEELNRAFRRLGAAAAERAASNRDAPAFPQRGAPPLPELALSPAPRPLDAILDDLVERVLPSGMRTDHPRFFAFIPSPASPISRVGDLATSIHNPHAGAARQSEGACAIEQSLVAFLCRAAGLPGGAGGLFVSGGSMANLTGLVAARDQRLSDADRPLAVAYVTEATHVSVAKALLIAGVTRSGLRLIPTDAAFRMDVAALRSAVAEDRQAGRKPFVVIATAGTTDTGAVDPLPEIADLCAEHGLWMHVDGAYGASALLCPERRGLLAGIERADSLSWDAHKWLFQTYGCGMVLVRDRAALLQSFRAGGDYLRDAAHPSEPDFWDLGPELTRPARAVKLWVTLQALGLDAVGRAIARGFRMAEFAERAVRALEGWTIVSPARMAIVAFRYAPRGLDVAAADAATLAAAEALMSGGFAVVGTTRIGGRAALRMCVINPETTEDDVVETLRRLDRFARAAF